MRLYLNQLIEFLVSSFFAILASVVLLYISIASGIGPWIAPVIVLAAAAFGKLLGLFRDNTSQRLALMQAAGTHVGLTAVAVGFTLPTYFFIEKTVFMGFVAHHPWQFCSGMAAFIALWSVIGTFLGQLFAEHFLRDSSLTIPVADVIKTTIKASGERQEFVKLASGIGMGATLCAAREALVSLLSKGFLGFGARSLWGIAFGGGVSSISPTIWAVGFIAGPAMAIALFIGLVSKYTLLQPLYALIRAYYSGYGLSMEQYLVAVSSGLVLADLFAGGASMLFAGFFALKNPAWATSVWKNIHDLWVKIKKICGNLHYELLGLSIVVGLCFFKAIGISSLWLMLFLVGSMGMSVYQMTLIAGQIGLVQFGRFATFVMLPALVFFTVTPLQAVVISAVVCILGAATSNLLFQYRLADDFSIPRSTMYKIQLLSSIFGAISIAIVFWLLCSHLTLGSAEFFAFRGYSRALLIQSFSFDILSVGIGLLLGLVLRYFGASPAMVLGGLLMPKELVLAFVLGAGLGYLIENPKKHMATASGVFAAEAVWVFLKILVKFV